MEPIISPWLIYIIETVLRLSQALFGLSIFGVIFFSLALSIKGCENGGDYDPVWAKRWKYALIIDIVVFFITCLIPGRETAYKMLLASYITPDNIDLGVKYSKEAIEYLVTAIGHAVNEIGVK